MTWALNGLVLLFIILASFANETTIAEPGCQYNYGLCHYGNTTINDIFKDLRPDARIHIRLLDKPHFPVLASWMRHDCYKRFYLQWSPTRPVEEQESHYYYTPIVVHPAGSPKTGHSKIDFFRTNGLWFLKDEDKHTLTRYAIYPKSFFPPPPTSLFLISKY